MKKRPLSNLVVKRISTSPYFKESFAQLEKMTIEKKAETLVLPFNSPELADILITNTHTRTQDISEPDFNHCKLLIHPNSGYDNLDTDFVRRAHFPIILGNPIRSHAVANYILSAFLNHYCPIPHQKIWDSERKWKRKRLSELSVLILGNGHIGKILEESLKPLVSRLLIFDPYLLHNELDLSGVDVLIPALGLNQKNIHLIDKTFLNKLNPDFLLINASRGQIISTSDLICVLKERPEAYAVLDVFENEPEDFNKFSELRNLTLTSHIAGVYSSIDEVTVQYVAQVIEDFKNLDLHIFKEKYKSVLLQNKLLDGMLI